MKVNICKKRLKYQLEGTLRKSQAGHIFETYNANIKKIKIATQNSHKKYVDDPMFLACFIEIGKCSFSNVFLLFPRICILSLFLGGVKISKRSPTPLIIQKYIFQIILRDSKLKLRLVHSEPKTCMHYGNNPTS